MVPNPTDQFIGELETQINLRADPTDPLLLAYGAVAANAAPDMQRQMVSFLTERLPEAEADEAALVHLLHSLGNTRSEIVIEHVVPFADHECHKDHCYHCSQVLHRLAMHSDTCTYLNEQCCSEC